MTDFHVIVAELILCGAPPIPQNAFIVDGGYYEMNGRQVSLVNDLPGISLTLVG